MENINKDIANKITNSATPEKKDYQNSNQNNSPIKPNGEKIILIKRNKNDIKKGQFNRGPRNNRQESKYATEIVQIKRVVKVVKGGRRFRFSVLMVVGDRKGKVGYAIGKANEIPNAARKARMKAEKNMLTLNFMDKNKSIPHEIKASHGASTIIMFPASKGTGVIAGGSARNILTFSGIQNIYTKAHGSRNKLNIIKATVKALQLLRTQEQIDKLKYNEEQ